MSTDPDQRSSRSGRGCVNSLTPLTAAVPNERPWCAPPLPAPSRTMRSMRSSTFCSCTVGLPFSRSTMKRLPVLPRPACGRRDDVRPSALDCAEHRRTARAGRTGGPAPRVGVPGAALGGRASLARRPVAENSLGTDLAQAPQAAHEPETTTAHKGPLNQKLGVGWLKGLEPSTTRITIWDSTN